MIPALRDAKHDESLGSAAFRVYLHLIEELSPVDFREKKIAVIASELRMPERTIKYAVAALIRRGYVEAGTRVVGSAQSYRLVYSRTPVIGQDVAPSRART